MKTVVSLLIFFSLALGLYAAEEVKKKGFLTSKWCAQNGYFADCRLESSVCGTGDCFKTWEFGDKVTDALVLYVHDEGRYYDIDARNLHRYELDEAFNRNNVEIIGELQHSTIIASEYKAPPPAKKEFFKGCL